MLPSELDRLIWGGREAELMCFESYLARLMVNTQKMRIFAAPPKEPSGTIRPDT